MPEKKGFLNKLAKAFGADVIKSRPLVAPLVLPPIPPKGKQPVLDDRPDISALPGGRSSIPSTYNVGPGDQFRKVNHQFVVEIIQIIRMLSIYNEDVSQAIHNIVSLGNTGHKIFFDTKVGPDQVDQMRNHLQNKRKNWAPGTAGIDGLVNKLFSQLLIGGALSGEWVPDNRLRGIQSCILVNPEEVVFGLDKNGMKYTPYQQPKTTGFYKPQETTNGLKKLNSITYQYIALNGDTEIPYGIPPYIPVIPRVETQRNMDKNINYVVDQLGLIGFLEVLIGKPDMDESIENDVQYEARLDNLLTQARRRILEGFKEGTVVGFKDDHEFEFKSAAKNFTGVTELYDNNEIMLASGLKQDASLLGRNYNTSETNITVVFTKMLSELRNIQNIVSNFLEYGYALELKLAGFNFDFIKVKFNKSTLQDDLKYQQGQEIKLRNVQTKMVLGLINQDQAADEMDYEVPAFPKPMVSWDVLAGGKDPVLSEGTPAKGAAKKADGKKKKTANAKKKRAENK